MLKSIKNSSLLDNVSFQIITSLVKDPQKTISCIAKEVGTSRATVRKKLKKLSEESLIRIQLSINSKNAQLARGLMFFILAHVMALGMLFNRLEHCPRVVSVITHIGQFHAMAFLVAENENNLLYTTECLQAQIKIKETNFVKLSPETILFPKFIELKIYPETDLGSCGLDCYECIRYIKKQCDGCPGSSRYRNTTSLLNLARYSPSTIKNQK